MAVDNPDQPLQALYAAIHGAAGPDVASELRGAVDTLHVIAFMGERGDLPLEQVQADVALFDQLARWCAAKRDALRPVVERLEQELA